MESWSAGVSRGLATGGYRESGAKRRVAVISTVGSYCWGHTHAAGRDNEGPQIRTNLTVSQTGAQQALGQTDRWIPATEGSPAHPLPFWNSHLASKLHYTLTPFTPSPPLSCLPEGAFAFLTRIKTSGHPS